MSPTEFSIGEWLVCPRCETICDAPFLPNEPSPTELELHIGQSLPSFWTVPSEPWQIQVSANCPHCHLKLTAIAAFHGHRLCDFKPVPSA